MAPDDRTRAASSSGAGAEDHDFADLRVSVERAVRSLCRGTLYEQVDDFVQEVMIRILRTIKKSEGDRTLSTVFLRTVAHSVIVDEVRRRARRPEYQMPENVREGTSTSVGPLTLTIEAELQEAIRECLGGMQRRRRAAVTLRLLGHTVPEVSEILGWNVKRAENYVYRGMQDLRSCLEHKGIEP